MKRDWIFVPMLYGLLGFFLEIFFKSKLIFSISGILISISIILVSYKLGVEKDRSLLSIDFDFGDTYLKFISFFLLVLGIIGICFFIVINFIDINMKF